MSNPLTSEERGFERKSMRYANKGTPNNMSTFESNHSQTQSLLSPRPRNLETPTSDYSPAFTLSSVASTPSAQRSRRQHAGGAGSKKKKKKKRSKRRR